MGDARILDLIHEARDKFRAAGAALTVAYRKDFVRLAWFTLPTGMKHLAEDIAQEVCLEATRSLFTFDAQRGSLRAWLNGIFVHCRVDVLEHYSHQELYPLASTVAPLTRDWDTDPDAQSDLIAISEERADLFSAILQHRMDQLDEQRRTILLMYCEGSTAPEITRAFPNLTPENIRQIIHRALLFLRTGQR